MIHNGDQDREAGALPSRDLLVFQISVSLVRVSLSLQILIFPPVNWKIGFCPCKAGPWTLMTSARPILIGTNIYNIVTPVIFGFFGWNFSLWIFIFLLHLSHPSSVCICIFGLKFFNIVVYICLFIFLSNLFGFLFLWSIKDPTWFIKLLWHCIRVRFSGM